MHYYRILRRHREGRKIRFERDDEKQYRSKTGLCEVEGCGRCHYAFGMCNFHWCRSREGRTITAPHWKDSRTGLTRKKDGYVLRWVGRGHPGANQSGLIPEHRYVMARMLGRDLLPGETVHHKNGVRDDNSPDNLELWVVSQPRGQRPADLVEWAEQILDRYSAMADVV